MMNLCWLCSELFLKNKSLQPKNAQGTVRIRWRINPEETAPSSPDNITDVLNDMLHNKIKNGEYDYELQHFKLKILINGDT